MSEELTVELTPEMEEELSAMGQGCPEGEAE